MKDNITVKIDWILVPLCIIWITFYIMSISTDVGRIANSLEKIASSTPELLTKY